MTANDLATTPMFQQFFELKEQVPGAVLLFRMGDFYECFFEDAELVAGVLGLALTSRNKADPNPIPMAGFPVPALVAHVQTLVNAGHRVAIGEQVEDPALAKGLVRRAIVRVVTPGVGLDPAQIDGREVVWLAALAPRGEAVGIAFFDASTGASKVTEVRSVALAVGELLRLEPKEILLEASLAEDPSLIGVARRLGAVVSPGARFDAPLTDLPGDPLPAEHAARAPLAAALDYAARNLGGKLGSLRPVEAYAAQTLLQVDDTTRRNLELHRTLLGGKRKGSLLGLLDRTVTAAGGRLLAEWISFPLLDPHEIRSRQEAVRAFVDEPDLREALRRGLREVADIARISARLAQGAGTPRDLAALRRSLLAVPDALAGLDAIPALARRLPGDRTQDVAEDLARWLVEEPPLTLGDGGVIRPGADPTLDRLIRLSVDGNAEIEALEAKEQAATGISSLKVRKNSVFGWYIEVTKANLHKVPKHFHRKQTISTGERFITSELGDLAEQVTRADAERAAHELVLFQALRDRVIAASDRLSHLARALSELDVLAAFADVAVRWRWVAPILDEGTGLSLVGSRHPVVEAALDDDRFVPNDVLLDPPGRSLIVLTGPNMAGKSTILRQVALIVLLAQTGSFVPADEARIGIVDRLFCRVGAADDLAGGRSTFMVEMAETAAILTGATSRSLVVLDEIGRGTSTFDGLSIAWAVAEHLVDKVRCRAMFATHYHELCELAESRPNVVNQSVAVSESGDRIVFLRRLKVGGASRSYGIQCARLAGVPAPVLDRARTLLTRFEKSAPQPTRVQLGLFQAAPPADRLRETLAALDPDALSPKEALDALYRLKALAE